MSEPTARHATSAASAGAVASFIGIDVSKTWLDIAVRRSGDPTSGTSGTSGSVCTGYGQQAGSARGASARGGGG